MKRLVILLFASLPCLAQYYPAPGKPKPIVITEEWRVVGGTNYNLGYLKAWLKTNRATPRPLPAWEEVEGKVERILKDGLLIRTYETIREYQYLPTSGSRLARMGMYVGGPPPPISLENRREVSRTVIEGPAFILKSHPESERLTIGDKVNVWAMSVGTTNRSGGERLKVYDHGIPVKPKA